ncbi:flavin reductase (DIM6/NTAB) family NADH-FMN oxidoreductase RutF [Nonomuraea thailandensis]|uniref:Flavin reductase (DIM6/NTAB) family NADH-FMN oxidoreductase RutF n=1 Tax=Nonomuraea thailandensis TaxID=1188745 RepID=A0A9X2K2W9_9ACTN|nr:flavin reductase [Nonomuraea thailandensis]MCP2357475.1 flavin reductase (DIM6/NTAB) family NADH-FMN oxidoreductase RutF [Nonomuraea thailandensis]
MATDGEAFRAVMAQWPSGVVIVTTGAGDRRHGMTASAFSSVSLDPPMVLVCLARGTRTHDLVTRNGTFAVSILGKDQAVLGSRFAGRDTDRFSGAAWQPGRTGSPVLADAVGWLDCRVAHAYPGGDHTIFVGSVVAAATPRRVPPVLFHSRAWSQLADPLPERISVADTGLLAVLRARGVPAPRAAALARRLRAAGVRVRLLDLYGGAPSPGDLDPATASALITRPEQVTAVAAAGAGVVEFRACAPPPRHRPDTARPRTAAGTGAGGRPQASPGPDAQAGIQAGVRAEECGALVRAARRAGMTVVGRLPDAFAAGREEYVVAEVARLAGLGCDEVALEEGASPATPLRLRHLLQEAAVAAGDAALRVGLRERHGIGLVNALVAMKSGVWRFDTTLGGVDGALPAEDVLLLAGELEVAGAADRAALVAGAAELERSWGSASPGRARRASETDSWTDLPGVRDGSADGPAGHPGRPADATVERPGRITDRADERPDRPADRADDRSGQNHRFADRAHRPHF